MSSVEEDHPLRPVPRHRYVNFEMTGEGAMGLVYIARDTELRRNVAFKIVRPDAGGSAPGDKPTTPLDASAPALDKRFVELSARFLQEAWVTGGMEHPGIAPVYELGQTDGGVPYYTMRFVRGQRTLSTALQELEDQPFEERLSVLEPFLKLCDAVSYAHARGVIHRDLKPANVALGEFGEVVLLDWGLAKLLARDEMTSDGPAPAIAGPTPDFQTDGLGMGTPGYMSPEAVRGGVDELDHRSDVYSLGVILFEILTGRLPNPVEPFPDYLEGILAGDAPSAQSVNPAIANALDSLCAQALCRARDDRLGTVRALSDGVRQWQTQSALERQMEGWLGDARSALAAAEESKGPSRIRQSQRALTVLEAARKERPASKRLQALQTQARALRNRGIKETQVRGRQRVVVVGGIALLFLLSIAAFIVAGVLNEKRKEAEQANLATAAALADATKQRKRAERQSELATEAEREAERAADRLRDLNELFAELLSGVRNPEGLARAIEKAVAQGNAGTVFLLTEKARGGRPFAHLATSGAIRASLIPPDLVEAAERARRLTGEAHRAYVAVLKRPLGERQRASKALTKAQEDHGQALQAILLYSLAQPLGATIAAAPTLEDVRATLGAGDVFVCYVRGKASVVAVVIDKTTERLVSLGDAALIEQEVASLRAAIDERRGASAPLNVLRDKLVETLQLPQSAGRVCFVPERATALVPFNLLLPEREVCILPSAGAYLHLRALPPAEGRGILAVADAIETFRARLPGARAEAEAIGSTMLLGPDATREKLAAALTGRSAWRAVHLGLRGRIAGRSPLDVYLIASPGETEDGRLGAFEIAQLEAGADLVVLASASVPLEDVGTSSLDIPQAILFAGARRVLFPTVSGDDEPTRALMVKFYELWNPRDGSAGMSAHAALKAAQAFVRSHEAWRDPAHWAAWVLWGLPD